MLCILPTVPGLIEYESQKKPTVNPKNNQKNVWNCAGYGILYLQDDYGLHIHSLNRSWKPTTGSRKWMACLQNGLFPLSSWSWGWFITSSLQKWIWYCTLRYTRWYVLDPKVWIFECENSLFKSGVALRESDRILNLLDLSPTQDASHDEGLWVFFSSKSQPKPLFANVTQWGVNATNLKLAGKSWWFTLSGDVQVCGVSASILDDLARHVYSDKSWIQNAGSTCKTRLWWCVLLRWFFLPMSTSKLTNDAPDYVYLQTWRQSDIPQFMGI